ncbi:hypothetical protein [Prosthecobacter sp.]|uniref:hypothetical protein n=1 Tax=Prosthecobacter sp. TaxID=1965333 RepID=UPI00248A5BA2|nr:hypothetical protein [Prosthecobacter sp.]MDI1311451.1 hypothetical protein [Prosthecobacter sp.]
MPAAGGSGQLDGWQWASWLLCTHVRMPNGKVSRPEYGKPLADINLNPDENIIFIFIIILLHFNGFKN